MLKILQVVAPTTAGGLERVVESLAIGHHNSGHAVTVAALIFGDAPTHPFVESLSGAGVSVREIRLTPRAYLRERREVAALCHDLRPDVVHTHGYRIDLLDRSVVSRLGVPTVTTVHGASKMGGLKGAFFEWLQRRNYRRFDAVVAVSTALHQAALRDGVPPARLHLIPNGWGGLRDTLPRDQAREALGLTESDTVVGWVGRLIHVKGGDVFLDAMSKLPAPRPIGVMIGYGPEEKRHRLRAARLGLGDAIRFYPDIRDASRYFPAFDTYVLSSRSEGLPIVLLEAMATNTPIVATRVGGVPDALTDAEAWLVSPDSPAELAASITQSLRDRSEAVSRARRASTRLEQEFAFGNWLKRYEQVYESFGQRGRATERSPLTPAPQ